MKLTPVLEMTLSDLKIHGKLYRMKYVYATPHVFGPRDIANEKPVNQQIGEIRVFALPNRQSLNKLVMLGYAEYEDKAKTIIKYIDKDAIDADLKRKAGVYDRVLKLEDTPLFEDETGLDLLGLSEEQLIDLDNGNLQLMYNNLLSMVYQTMAHIEELEDEND